MRLDIVIPAHNEERRIGPTLRAYRAACGDHPQTRFVVALDACADATAEVVAAHRRADPRVELVEYPRLGKGGVLMEGLGRSRADVVAFVDADGATPPRELLRLVHAMRRAGADGAIASRWHPAAVLPARRPLARRIASAGFALGVRGLFRLPYADTQCGAKVLGREAVRRVLPLLTSRDFLFDVDLLLALRGEGLRVVEVPTVWVDREGSRVRAGSDATRMGASLLRLWASRSLAGLQPRRRPAHAT